MYTGDSESAKKVLTVQRDVFCLQGGEEIGNAVSSVRIDKYDSGRH